MITDQLRSRALNPKQQTERRERAREREEEEEEKLGFQLRAARPALECRCMRMMHSRHPSMHPSVHTNINPYIHTFYVCHVRDIHTVALYFSAQKFADNILQDNLLGSFQASFRYDF